MIDLRFATAVVTIALVLPANVSAQASRGEARGLLEFETAVKWSEVSTAWRDRRSSWLEEVRKAGTPQEVGKLAVELESAMGWGSVEPSWKQARPGWVKLMTGAETAAMVAQGLLQLEAATQWKAVEASWKQARPGWVRRMEQLAGQ